MNTHFDHKGFEARNESAKLIRSELEKKGLNCNFILTGDFNADVRSKPYQLLFDVNPVSSLRLRDAYAVVHGNNGSPSGTF